MSVISGHPHHGCQRAGDELGVGRPLVLPPSDDTPTPFGPLAAGATDGLVTASVAVLPGSFVSAAGFGAALAGVSLPSAACAGTPAPHRTTARATVAIDLRIMGYPPYPSTSLANPGSTGLFRNLVATIPAHSDSSVCEELRSCVPVSGSP
jgi:hypothetical protein